jgi:hypothetical protein
MALPPEPPLPLELPPDELPDMDMTPPIPAGEPPAPPEPEPAPPLGSGAVSESLAPEQAPEAVASAAAEIQPKTNFDFEMLIMIVSPTSSSS